MNSEKPSRCSVGRLLDAGVYAPVGFLVNRDQAVADLAATGRKQLAFARSLGRVALKGLSRSTPAEPATKAQTGADTPVVSEPAEVPGYADMSAVEVIALVSGCTTGQAAWIRNAELAGKNRVTIIRALDKRHDTV